MTPAERPTPVGGKNSAAFADGPGAVLEHVACGRALVSWWVIACLLGPPWRCDLFARPHYKLRRHPGEFGQMVGLRRFALGWLVLWRIVERLYSVLGAQRLGSPRRAVADHVPTQASHSSIYRDSSIRLA